MDTNTAPNQSKMKKKGFFDPTEIKGLSPKAARAVSSGKLSAFLRAVSRLLAFTSARAYGLIFLTFGVLTLFLHLGEYYFMDDPTVAVSSLLIGAASVIISLFLIVSDKPICIALQSVKVVDFVVFDFFSINRMQYSEGERRFGASAGILIGFILSILGFFFPTEYAALVMLGFIFVTVALISPEFPFIFSVLLFPYLSVIPFSSYILAGTVVLSIISFARKVLVGKRVYSFEIYDCLFIFLIIAVLITGVILGEGENVNISLLTVLYLVGYVPASNIAVNRRLFDCISGAAVASSIPVALYSVIRYTVNIFFFEREASRAFFDSPEILAAYMSTIIIFSLYLSVKRSRTVKKNYYFSTFILSSLSLLTTEYFAILPVLIFALLSFTILRSKNIPRVIMIVLLALPFTLFLLPDATLSWISDTLSLSPAIEEIGSRMQDLLSFFSDHLFLGMGSGASPSPEALSSNSYLAIAARFGILAILAFLYILVLRVLHVGFYNKFYSDSALDFYVDMCTLAVFSMLMFGSFSDIFADTEMIYFFVVIFGMGSAALRNSKKEKEELQSYYHDQGSSDFAAIDVTLKK